MREDFFFAKILVNKIINIRDNFLKEPHHTEQKKSPFLHI